VPNKNGGGGGPARARRARLFSPGNRRRSFVSGKCFYVEHFQVTTRRGKVGVGLGLSAHFREVREQRGLHFHDFSGAGGLKSPMAGGPFIWICLLHYMSDIRSIQSIQR